MTTASSAPLARTADAEAPGHIPALDGVRGLAIVLVLFYHATIVKPDQWWSAALVGAFRNFGWCGVDLFFVLSGLLITGLLLDARPFGHFFRNFYARRVLRIFPLYYGYLALVLVAWPLISPQTAARAVRVGDDGWWYWLYLQNYVHAGAGDWVHSPVLNHLWSLAIEEQFYLVWPLLVFALPRRALAAACGAIVVAAPIARLLLLDRGVAPLALYVLTPTRLDALAAGGLLACIAREPDGLRSLARWTWPPLLLAATAAIGAIAWHERSFSYGRPLVAGVGLTALAAFCAAVLVLAVAAPSESARSRFFGSGLLRMFGRYSYAMYVFHFPVLNALDRAEHWLVATWDAATLQLFHYAAGFAITTLLAVASWHLYELHFLRLKRFFATPTRPASGN